MQTVFCGSLEKCKMAKSHDEWKERILVMPAVSVGNVGQLAVDLLLASLDVKHAGHLYHESFLPMIGADPFDFRSKKLVTSCQVYDCPAHNLVIVQHRAPITPKSRKKYIEFMINWIQEHQFKMVVLLSSCFSEFFTADDLQGVPMHYLCTKKIHPDTESSLRCFAWKTFRLRELEEFSGSQDIPGGGVTKDLFKECDENGIALVAMILVCSEGDNCPEAFHMVDQLNRWLKLKEEKGEVHSRWKMPPSWCSFFGNSPPSTMY